MLLFNCMRERDPAVLLPVLAAKFSPRTSLDAAIFTPMLSGGGVLLPAHAVTQSHPQQQQTPVPAAVAVASRAADLSWQARMLHVWESTQISAEQEKQLEGKMNNAYTSTAISSASAPTASTSALSVTEGTDGGRLHTARFQQGEPSGRLYGLPAASVSVSLPAALEALRAAAAADPLVHVHVLVTGSLYLVGDMLRLLNKPPA